MPPDQDNCQFLLRCHGLVLWSFTIVANKNQNSNSDATGQARGLVSLSVVEDYAEGVAAAGAETTYAVTEVDAIRTLPTLDRTITNRKHHAVAL